MAFHLNFSNFKKCKLYPKSGFTKDQFNPTKLNIK